MADNKEFLGTEKRTRCETYSRVVGYLRPVKQWNDGKQAEFSIRKTFEASAPLIEGHDD